MNFLGGPRRRVGFRRPSDAGLYNKNAGVVSSAVKARDGRWLGTCRGKGGEAAHNWLASTGGPSVAVVKILCELGGDKIGGNIGVGDAKAAADAARMAAIDAGNGFETSRDNLDQRAGAVRVGLQRVRRDGGRGLVQARRRRPRWRR